MVWEKGKSGNVNGRPKGAKSKVMSDKDFAKAIQSNEMIVIKRMMDIVKNGSDGDALKAGIKMMEWSIKIREGALVLTKTKEDGSKEEYEVEEKKQGNGEPVVQFKKLNIVPKD